ncbi:hypothetical protein AWC38_SpisGene10484 [Stylophora pistillata]|uniref:Uncharacterized protein n=1 Tax=Stylophora pistillata TaxID=50429 RepID=A0A2B4S8P6_STYPI|nr:hypothetical protein AWC38_SpisGene10484 [Stylophora pistillata]
MAAAHDLDCQDLEEFLDSMRQCFDEVEKELNDERNSILLDYLESRLEDHFQVVHAIAIVIQSASDSRSDELKQLVEDLLSVSQSLLQEIHTTKIQREINERSSPAWVPSREARTGGRPRFSITKEQIETFRETGMNWKGIAALLGISESTMYRRRQEFGLHESFVEITDEELYTVEKAKETLFKRYQRSHPDDRLLRYSSTDLPLSSMRDSAVCYPGDPRAHSSSAQWYEMKPLSPLSAPTSRFSDGFPPPGAVTDVTFSCCNDLDTSLGETMSCEREPTAVATEDIKGETSPSSAEDTQISVDHGHMQAESPSIVHCSSQLYEVEVSLSSAPASRFSDVEEMVNSVMYPTLSYRNDSKTYVDAVKKEIPASSSTPESPTNQTQGLLSENVTLATAAKNLTSESPVSSAGTSQVSVNCINTGPDLSSSTLQCSAPLYELEPPLSPSASASKFSDIDSPVGSVTDVPLNYHSASSTSFDETEFKSVSSFNPDSLRNLWWGFSCVSEPSAVGTRDIARESSPSTAGDNRSTVSPLTVAISDYCKYANSSFDETEVKLVSSFTSGSPTSQWRDVSCNCELPARPTREVTGRSASSYADFSQLNLGRNPTELDVSSLNLQYSTPLYEIEPSSSFSAPATKFSDVDLPVIVVKDATSIYSDDFDENFRETEIVKTLFYEGNT